MIEEIACPYCTDGDKIVLRNRNFPVGEKSWEVIGYYKCRSCFRSFIIKFEIVPKKIMKYEDYTP